MEYGWEGYDLIKTDGMKWIKDTKKYGADQGGCSVYVCSWGTGVFGWASSSGAGSGSWDWWFLDSEVVRASWDVLIAPFYHQDVLALLLELVGDVVEAVAQVFHQDFLTWNFRPINSNQQHVPPCFAAVYTKAVLLANKSFGETQAFSNHSTGIRCCLLTGRHATGNGVHHHGRGLVHAVATDQARASDFRFERAANNVIRSTIFD